MPFPTGLWQATATKEIRGTLDFGFQSSANSFQVDLGAGRPFNICPSLVLAQPLLPWPRHYLRASASAVAWRWLARGLLGSVSSRLTRHDTENTNHPSRRYSDETSDCQAPCTWIGKGGRIGVGLAAGP